MLFNSMSGGVIFWGYYTAFKKPIINDFVSFHLRISPSPLRRLFTRAESYNANVVFGLTRGFKIYHLFFIPLFFKRVFFLYNQKIKVYYPIPEELEEVLEECEDNQEEYKKAVNNFFRKEKE